MLFHVYSFVFQTSCLKCVCVCSPNLLLSPLERERKTESPLLSLFTIPLLLSPPLSFCIVVPPSLIHSLSLLCVPFFRLHLQFHKSVPGTKERRRITVWHRFEEIDWQNEFLLREEGSDIVTVSSVVHVPISLSLSFALKLVHLPT